MSLRKKNIKSDNKMNGCVILVSSKCVQIDDDYRVQGDRIYVTEPNANEEGRI